MSKNPWNTHEAALAWGVTMRRVRQLCAGGRVPGARLAKTFVRGDWVIPRNSPKPDDARRLAVVR